MPANEAVVQALARRLGAELRHTHISWILLGDGIAWKVKKAVRYPFVDYGTLERRRHFCEEEVRLNQRLAPGLYLGVSRITGTAAEPQLDGAGPALEYAVRMRRFPAGALFSEQLQAGALGPQAVDDLAERLARFHAEAPRADASPAHGTPALQDRALAALEAGRDLFSDEQHATLQGWVASQARELQPLAIARRAQGCVRESHGDLHLDNILTLDGAVAAFDCIEFAPHLRWIDVFDDAVFAFMDFAARVRLDYAWRFLDGWLDRTGDHGALPLLRLLCVYRALVRAMAEHMRAARSAAARRYAAAALGWLQPAAPRLYITHGLPGSGKSFQSLKLLQSVGALRLRSDVERKRLYGLAMLDDSRAHGVDLYTAEATRRTYQLLHDKAAIALRAGHSVVLDAAYLRRDERAEARALARSLGVPFAIVPCKAPLPVLRQRLALRRGDASEADASVLEKLQAAAEPLAGDELNEIHLVPGETSC
jgi:aminoglycoside phosphotransferase family enzyme/predicted kinase